MNGKRYLLDTNAVIQLLAGNPSLRKMMEDKRQRTEDDPLSSVFRLLS